MKQGNSHPYLQSFNGENRHPNGVKEKRKTVYIKLHPKPNAPRHSAIKLSHAPLQPR
jgi:hypothetical protein